MIGFLAAQGGGRLVEDQELGVEGERLGDLDLLLGSDLIVSVSIAGDQLPFLGAALAMQTAITASAQ